MESLLIRRHTIDLNIPCGVEESSFAPGCPPSNYDQQPSSSGSVPRKRKRAVGTPPNPRIYQDLGCSKGGVVKAHRAVLRLRNLSRERPPNVICKVELFGKLLLNFDDQRNGWVDEMGFGALKYLVNMKLPRSLCYWLMTRIDPVNERLTVGGQQYRFSPNSVRWVLGIPKGEIPVPTTFPDVVSRRKVEELEEKYGQVWTSVDGRSGKVERRAGLSITQAVVDRLISPFRKDEEEEFKMLFLLAALDMVLCPTQATRFSRELFPALCCAADCINYNWCSLVLEKLMASVKRFGSRFYAEGFASGCGGCTLFLAIFYLDRLDRNAVSWGTVPRVKVWSNAEIKRACDDDRLNVDGDFGCSGVLDIAYGEKHPHDPRDADIPAEAEKELRPCR